MKLPHVPTAEILVQGLLLTMLVHSNTTQDSSCYPEVMKDRQFFYYQDRNRDYSKWVRHFVAYVLLLDIVEDYSQLDTKEVHSSSEVLPKTTPLKKIRNKFKRRKKIRYMSSVSHQGHTSQQLNGNSSLSDRPPNALPRRRRIEVNFHETTVVERKKVRRRNEKSKTVLILEAEKYFQKAVKINSFTQTIKNFMKCKSICSQLKRTGDVSVCYWCLGEIAFEKCYYIKATRFYGKAIETYHLAQMFEKYQHSLSVVCAQYSNACCRCTRNESQTQAVSIADLQRKCRQEQDDTEYSSCINWPKSVPSVDVPNARTEKLVSHNICIHSSPQMECDMLEVAEEEQGYFEDICNSILYDYAMMLTSGEDTEVLPAVTKVFYEILGDS